MTTSDRISDRTSLALRLIVFLTIAIVGLFYVKWFPYYNRAFVAAANHSIGNSILMGTAAAPPAPSWDAALGYAMAYVRRSGRRWCSASYSARPSRRSCRSTGFRE